MPIKKKIISKGIFSSRFGIDWSFLLYIGARLLMTVFSPCSTVLKSRKLLFRSEAFLADKSFLLGNDWLFLVHVGAYCFPLVCTIVISFTDESWLFCLDWSFYSTGVCNDSNDKFFHYLTLHMIKVYAC